MRTVICPDCDERVDYGVYDGLTDVEEYEQCDRCARHQYEAEYEEAREQFETEWWG